MSIQSTGVIIGRMNPPHIGHVKLIKKSLFENENTLVYIGTKNLKDEKNPFSFGQIKRLLSIVFNKEIQNKKLLLAEIQDLPKDRDWIYSLQKKLKRDSTGINIVFYGGDLKNDYAILCMKEYIGEMKEYNISFKEQNRYGKKLYINGQDIDISSTTLRLALKEKNMMVIDNIVDKKIIPDLLLEYSKLKNE